MTIEPDYISINPASPTQHPGKFCVSHMVYNVHSDDYTMRRCSQALPYKEADLVAKSWAADLRLEIR